MKRIGIFLLGLVMYHSAWTADLTLSEIRNRLIGQQVTIHGDQFPSHAIPDIQGKMAFWKVATPSGEFGYRITDQPAPGGVKGKTGKVVAILLKDTSLFGSKSLSASKDAFGNQINEGSKVNPYISVIVQLDDGLHIGTVGYYSSLMNREMRLASENKAQQSNTQAYLDSLMGKTLYTKGTTELLDPNLSLEDLLHHTKRQIAIDSDVKPLTPLKVVNAKVLEADNAVIIKVSLPDGKERLLFGKLNDNSEYHPSFTPLERMDIWVADKYPKKLSIKEIAAIKEKSIFRGMSEEALYWSWGFPDKTNDYGRGGKQYIYGDGQYVYSNGKKVTDWQSIR